MKELSDGTQVSSRTYYYLLDFNDRDSWKVIMDKFNTGKLHALNIAQYIELFEIATQKDLQDLNKS